MNPTDRRSIIDLIEKVGSNCGDSLIDSESPPYNQYEVISDVDVEGFHYGVISDLGAKTSYSGDGFIVAPDDSRCGIVWEVTNDPLFEQLAPFDRSRWGIWRVGFRFPVDSSRDIEANLRVIIDVLKSRWLAWKEVRSASK